MLVMSDSYYQLLEAAIRHLEDRKAQGGKFISVSQTTMAALVSPCVRESNAAAAAPNRTPVQPPPALPFFESSVAGRPAAASQPRIARSRAA
jgi:hypothetical protein